MQNANFNHRIGEVFELKTYSHTKLNGVNENDSHTDLPSDTSECNGILSTIESTNNKSPIHNTTSLLGKEKDKPSSKDEFGYTNSHQDSNNEGNIRLHFKLYVYLMPITLSYLKCSNCDSCILKV